MDVPTSQCDSGQSYSESRNRSATGNGCVSETETRVVCKLCVVVKCVLNTTSNQA